MATAPVFYLENSGQKEKPDGLQWVHGVSKELIMIELADIFIYNHLYFYNYNYLVLFMSINFIALFCQMLLLNPILFSNHSFYRVFPIFWECLFAVLKSLAWSTILSLLVKNKYIFFESMESNKFHFFYTLHLYCFSIISF